MSRKNDIDRWLDVIDRTLIPGIRLAFENRKDKDQDDLIFSNIKSALEHLRSVFDYAINDLADVTPHMLQLGQGQDLYFPFVQPVSRAGNPKSPGDIKNEFDHKLLVPEIKQHHRPIYDLIDAVQGLRWLAELFKTVNPQKHDRAATLGKRALHISSGGPRPATLILEGNGLSRCEGDGSLIIVGPDGREIVAPNQPLSADLPIPLEIRPYARVIEDISVAAIDDWIARLTDWNHRTRALMDAIYVHYPK